MMPVAVPPKIKRRGRIVSFRVSEEEYLNLCKATESAGADSISDFARHVACHHSLVFSTGNGNSNGHGNGNGAAHGDLHSSQQNLEVLPAPALAIEVTRLGQRVDELTKQMQILTRRVNRGI
jgi:hypothetical protein